MNALPPSGLPAVCVRGAGSRGQRPIALCAGIAAKNRRKAERARCAKAKAAGIQYGGRDPERCREFARDREQAARSGTAGRSHSARAVPHIHPLKAARCANRATWHGVTGSGNNMPRGGPPVLCGRCGTPAPSDAAYCDRCAGSAAKRSRKKAKNSRSRQRYVQRRVRRLCIDCGAPSQGASGVLCAPAGPGRVQASIAGLPVLPPRFTVIEIATGANHGTWDRWEDVVMCLAFAKLSRDQVELIPDM